MSDSEMWDDLEREDMERLREDITGGLIWALHRQRHDDAPASTRVDDHAYRADRHTCRCGRTVTLDQWAVGACCAIAANDIERKIAYFHVAHSELLNNGFDSQKLGDFIGTTILSL